MARIHRILDVDRTPFLHTHPFWYVSIVLRGGYDERIIQSDGKLKTIKRRAGSIVFRRANVAHRIDNVHGDCTTLFLTWKLAGPDQNWKLLRHPDVARPQGYNDYPDGLYRVAGGFRLRRGGSWFAKRDTIADAVVCDRLSIHQNIDMAQRVENL